MIYTSYFAKLKQLSNNYIPVSICGRAPDWYNGLQYKQLAPKWKFFNEWKQNNDNDFYVKHFKEEVLNKTSTSKILFQLSNLLPDEIKNKLTLPIWLDDDFHIVLMCYEKPDKFCHRFLVSKWLNENGIECKELSIKNE